MTKRNGTERAAELDERGSVCEAAPRRAPPRSERLQPDHLWRAFHAADQDCCALKRCRVDSLNAPNLL